MQRLNWFVADTFVDSIKYTGHEGTLSHAGLGGHTTLILMPHIKKHKTVHRCVISTKVNKGR